MQAKARCRAENFERTQFRKQRRIERDFVETRSDYPRGCWKLAPMERIDLHDQHIFYSLRLPQRQDWRIGAIAKASPPP
jgi:hypothetical protein